MSYEKAMVKLNGGEGALLCNRCSIIVSTGKADYRDIEHYCEDCYNKVNQKVEHLQKQLERIEYHLKQIKALTKTYCMDDTNISRVEVIGPDGREYVRYFEEDEFMHFMIQDEGQTLKLFIEDCK